MKQQGEDSYVLFKQLKEIWSVLPMLGVEEDERVVCQVVMRRLIK